MSTSRGPITCHVLDSSRGMPGMNIQVKLEVRETSSEDFDENGTETWNVVGQSYTNEDGRCPNLVPEDYKIALKNNSKATYRITFYTSKYFNKLDQKSFYPYITDSNQHYHVPLLISPFSYTTYRGS
ncbi:8828_t:CDS:2 [Funneliformis geosporum]|uniref:5-hydroxyisourate hydrolase n=1 Tax=Funneliformis geosporum TaxID=1117311 RepID=A0A9W4WN63_9GLOM|nr:8828_t:CDS:2 [Funneliformis geosporum]CAI2174457.1 14637_t:CDS:2 [Funneliformis geosporum]